MSREIQLTRGKVALVSDHQYEKVARLKWQAEQKKYGKWYAGTRMNGKRVYLHRFLANALTGMEIDHINGDTLDNRDENLRFCTHAQQQNPIHQYIGIQGRYLE